MLKRKHSLYVLQLLAQGKKPRMMMSSKTAAKCFKELAENKLIEKVKGKYEPSERGLKVLRLLEGGEE